MGVALVSLFLLTMIVAASPYRDYPGSRMPDYGIDDENHEIPPTPDDFADKLPHVGASLDYRYEEESKPALDVEIDDTIINKNKRFSPKSTSEDIHVDSYNTQEEIMPEDAPRKRKGKINRRKHTRFNSESGNSIFNHSRNRKVKDDNTDNEDYRVREEDYREKEEKEADRFHRREIINKQARRKPRERPINLILRDSETQYVKNDEDVNDHEEKKSQSQERHFNKQDSPKVFEYEFDDMRRVNNLKGKLMVTTRRTTAEETTPTAVFIAARELGALLGHRQRKDIQGPYNLSPRLPTTFSPRAADVQLDDEWNRFIKFNRASRIHCSVIMLTLLNYGQLLK